MNKMVVSRKSKGGYCSACALCWSKTGTLTQANVDLPLFILQCQRGVPNYSNRPNANYIQTDRQTEAIT